MRQVCACVIASFSQLTAERSVLAWLSDSLKHPNLVSRGVRVEGWHMVQVELNPGGDHPRLLIRPLHVSLQHPNTEHSTLGNY